jgi:N-methylhydantoinase A
MDVMVPPSPGVLCAMGVLTKDMQIDVSQTCVFRESDANLTDNVARVFDALERRARDVIRRGRISGESLAFNRSVEARYVGQNFELAVPVATDAHGRLLTGSIRPGFDAMHQRLYGYGQPSKELEFVTFRLRASMPGPKVDVATQTTTRRGAALRPLAHREVLFDSARRRVDCPIFDRSHLIAGDEIAGPAIIEQMDTTTVLPPDFRASVDTLGDLLLRRR